MRSVLRLLGDTIRGRWRLAECEALSVSLGLLVRPLNLSRQKI